LLLAHGDADTVVPINQSEEFHAALKERKKVVELSVNPGEGHGRSKKQTRVDAYRRMEQWFDRYLKD
jgi:dipeptidyl aminopeptidase/acylaminoacyl peptidase